LSQVKFAVTILETNRDKFENHSIFVWNFYSNNLNAWNSHVPCLSRVRTALNWVHCV